MLLVNNSLERKRLAMNTVQNYASRDYPIRMIANQLRITPTKFLLFFCFLLVFTHKDIMEMLQGLIEIHLD